MAEAECIVVGGGLAGSAAALTLARGGRSVILLEKTTGPHHKVCGEFLSAEAQAALASLGVDIWALGAERITKLRVVARRRKAEAALPFTAAGLSRYALDEALILAAKEAGAEVRRGVAVSKLGYEGGRPAVMAGEDALCCEQVVLATGKHDMREIGRALGHMTAQKLQIALPPQRHGLLTDTVQLALFDGGYIGACFVEEKIVTICWTLENEIFKSVGGRWPQMKAFLSHQSPLLAALLAHATPLFDKPCAVAGIPYGYLRKQTIAPHIYPVGDQLAVIPSYTGDGTAIALQTGMEAGRAILAGRPASAFQRDMMARLEPQFRFAGMGNLFFENGAARQVGMTIAQVFPSFMTTIARATRLRGFDLAASAP